MLALLLKCVMIDSTLYWSTEVLFPFFFFPLQLFPFSETGLCTTVTKSDSQTLLAHGQLVSAISSPRSQLPANILGQHFVFPSPSRCTTVIGQGNRLPFSLGVRQIGCNTTGKELESNPFHVRIQCISVVCSQNGTTADKN